MTNPNNIVAFDDVRRVLKGVMIEPVVVTEDDFRRFMATTYAQLTAKPEATQSRTPARPAAAASERDRAPANGAHGRDGRSAAVGYGPRAAAGGRQRRAGRRNQAGPDERVGGRADHPARRIRFSGLAIKQGASDIHIEPMEEDVTHPLPHRRRPAGRAAAAEAGAARPHLAPEDSQPARYLGEAPAAGRPHQRD